MNRKTLVLPAVIGLLAPVLAACGGSDGGGNDDKPIVVGTTDRFAVTKQVPAPFDPAYAYDVGSWNLMRQTVQGLMRVPRGGGEPEPDAAEKCGFTDSGNERYECTLREGLTFADGTPITSSDVKFSLARVLSLKAETAIRGLFTNIDTMETPSKRKVVFHLKSADATFPYKLATPNAGLVSSKQYSAKKFRKGFQLDGSGPYTVDMQSKGGELTKAVYTKNPKYKGSIELQNNKAEVRPFASSAAMTAKLKSGEVDVLGRTITPAEVKSMSENPPKHVSLVESPGLEISYVAFNTESGQASDKAVRQAMAQLIDRGEIASKAYGTAAEPLYSIVPATITGHTNPFFNVYGDPSTEKARTILGKANITTPVKLDLTYTTDHYGTQTKKQFEVLSKQLNDSGLFDVTIKGKPWDTFRGEELKRKYDVYGMGWFPDFADPDSFIAPFLDKENILNTPYDNEEIRSKLIPQSRSEADRLSATPSIEDIQDIVAKDVPMLPIWQGKTYAAARDDITGVEWVLSSSSVLQLWELGRGVAG
ncbi:ABC transporter substrate-binding protein [Streptomyces tsukubensis]|uniref:Peptide-binding protein n=1 Tax=Streptomyces tsukubensis TaxID=83656 RepID=A0A1V4AE75_9ACTN|nr:ABC transporter substrate-binding protein [Streptomyces tsukubensis]OON82275.1 peptide-binding protein [Streptomyces tsukubensis]QFR92765.1 peptide-binding protein [Streptomyces tsukubensis]